MILLYKRVDLLNIYPILLDKDPILLNKDSVYWKRLKKVKSGNKVLECSHCINEVDNFVDILN